MTSPTITRRGFLAATSATLCAPPLLKAETRWPLTVTDAIGRMVTITKKPKSIILGTGFNLFALSLIHPDPVSLLAGWATDMKTDNPFIYDAFRKKFPALDKVPLVSNGQADGMSFEAALSLEADLAVMGRWQAEGEQGKRAIDYLASIGVPVIVVDFNLDPLKSTPRDIRLLGRVLECDQPAESYAQFFERRVERIRVRAVGKGGDGPLVLMDAFPSATRGSWAVGRTGLGELITLAGGRNIADKNLPPQGGPVTAEYIIAAEPDVYIATGSPGGTYTVFSIGPGVDPAEALQSLQETVKAPSLAPLKAVREGNVHGMWNFFNAVPLNVLAAEAVASWVRPDLFGDVDPASSLAEINERFAAVPFEGAYWTSLTS
ncbi:MULTISPECIES: ABC transporter substrate-binding protein [unclassified Rhizobium]|uniref:ABC transporter substrate-binding protein n=1 Tax=unclassified Rhizobium TaxID=2613769 RepID=UPI001044215E|nr:MULTISPECIES: ABC transporter substrate-binding protein [unclassified Rhizobium]MBB3397615.1 iron complex transport system substrate-binding protein [Rhizobium sp. BK060]MBB4166984.1 iron complex transport system substrate-binding protein [Rhizobium sp. BK538]TCM73448.1 iron complex transport system substrate-binding protein [Rhizobium sp. BK068]